MDLHAHADEGFYASAGKIAPARISLKVVDDLERTQAENRPVKKEIEWIEIFVDQGTIIETAWEKLSEEERRNYSPLYKRFQDKKLPTTVDGTPLSDLTWMSRARAEEWAASKVFTVEHLVNAKEEQIKRAGMGAREEIAKAKAFLKAASDSKHTAKLAKENEQLKDLVATLQEELRELSEAFKESKAQKVS